MFQPTVEGRALLLSHFHYTLSVSFLESASVLFFLVLRIYTVLISFFFICGTKIICSVQIFSLETHCAAVLSFSVTYFNAPSSGKFPNLHTIKYNRDINQGEGKYTKGTGFMYWLLAWLSIQEQAVLWKVRKCLHICDKIINIIKNTNRRTSPPMMTHPPPNFILG